LDDYEVLLLVDRKMDDDWVNNCDMNQKFEVRVMPNKFTKFKWIVSKAFKDRFQRVSDFGPYSLEICLLNECFDFEAYCCRHVKLIGDWLAILIRGHADTP